MKGIEEEDLRRDGDMGEEDVVRVARLFFWGVLKAECGSLGTPGSKWSQKSS